MISIYIPVFNKRFYDLQNGSIFSKGLWFDANR